MGQFVQVRLVKANEMDLTQFQFDYDLTFAMVFLNADGTVYGRYGTRSSRDEAEKDMSLEGLAETLAAVLELHKEFPANQPVLSGKQPQPTRYQVPDDFPSLKGKFPPELDFDGKLVSSCMHCHQIRDAHRQVYRSAAQPIPDRLLFPYPIPATIGFTMDPKRRAVVSDVAPDSAAAHSGLQAGDEILLLDGQRVVSTADIQWILHHAQDSDQLPALLQRDGERRELKIELAKGWRRATDLGWRVSSWPLRRMGTGGLVLESVTPDEREQLGVEPGQLALRVGHVGQYGAHAAAKRAGFRKGDVVVSFDAQDRFKSESELLAYASQHTRPGQRVAVSVLRGKKRIELKLPMQE